MSLPTVSVSAEGIVDEAVLRRILEYVGLPCGVVYGKAGKEYILRRLPNYNQAAKYFPWLVDLDQDADCAPDFAKQYLPAPADQMHFRVAVRAIESWLMGDAEHLAAFLAVPKAKVPVDPDTEIQPKVTLVNVARHSRRPAIRQDMVPREGSGSVVGPGYNGRLIEFVSGIEQRWRPEVAMQTSDSLKRCIKALETLKGGE
jgi:hypothetical protein